MARGFAKFIFISPSGALLAMFIFFESRSRSGRLTEPESVRDVLVTTRNLVE